jgi:hypothetical protein
MQAQGTFRGHGMCPGTVYLQLDLQINVQQTHPLQNLSFLGSEMLL